MIVVFGSINLDLVARVERLPEPGETVTGTSFAWLPGGKGANQALAARRAGAEVAMAGAVGDDIFAEKALSGLVDADVDIRWIRKVAEPTGVALIHVDRAGQNSITVVPGANARASAESIPDVALGADTTVVMQLETPVAEACALAFRAHTRGARVILNAAPAIALPDALLSTIGVLVVNETEAISLATALGVAAAPEQFASAMHRRYGHAAIVTLAERGALAAVDGMLLRAPTLPVEVVDSIGAGDAFVGALAAARDRGTNWHRALSEAVGAGALACSCAGAQSALPWGPTIQSAGLRVESMLVSQPLG